MQNGLYLYVCDHAFCFVILCLIGLSFLLACFDFIYLLEGNNMKVGGENLGEVREGKKCSKYIAGK